MRTYTDIHRLPGKRGVTLGQLRGLVYATMAFPDEETPKVTTTLRGRLASVTVTTEADPIPVPDTWHPDGIDLMGQERDRQVRELGYTADHDDTHHANGELVLHALDRLSGCGIRTLPLDDLVQAGALLAAEIDRRIRAGEPVPVKAF